MPFQYVVQNAAAVSIQSAFRSFQSRRNLLPSLFNAIITSRSIMVLQRWWKKQIFQQRMTMLIVLRRYLYSLRHCRTVKISYDSIQRLDAFPNYVVSNGLFPEHHIRWTFNIKKQRIVLLEVLVIWWIEIHSFPINVSHAHWQSAFVSIFASNQSGQRIPRWIFPEKIVYETTSRNEDSDPTQHVKSSNIRTALHQLLTVDCTSKVNPQHNEWTITFRNVKDTQIRAALLFFMTYDPLTKSCCRFQPMSLDINCHSSISLHSEIAAEHIDKTYLKLVDAQKFGKRHFHPRPQTANIVCTHSTTRTQTRNAREITELASSAYYEVRFKCKTCWKCLHLGFLVEVKSNFVTAANFRNTVWVHLLRLLPIHTILPRSSSNENSQNAPVQRL